MRLNTLFKIRIISMISFTIFIFFCYTSISSNAQWDPYLYTEIPHQQWSVIETLPGLLPLRENIIDIMHWVDTTSTNVIPNFMSYTTVPGSIDSLSANWGVKTAGSYDSFMTQGFGLSCFLLPYGTGVPYCPGVSIKIKVYWRDPGNRLRSAIQWYGTPLPYGPVFTIYPVFPRGPTDN